MNKNLKFYVKIANQVVSVDRMNVLKQIMPSELDFLNYFNPQIVEAKTEGKKTIEPMIIAATPKLFRAVLKEIGSKTQKDLLNPELDIKTIPVYLGLKSNVIKIIKHESEDTPEDQK